MPALQRVRNKLFAPQDYYATATNLLQWLLPCVEWLTVKNLARTQDAQLAMCSYVEEQ